jgi:hypothetical protein
MRKLFLMASVLLAGVLARADGTFTFYNDTANTVVLNDYYTSVAAPCDFLGFVNLSTVGPYASYSFTMSSSYWNCLTSDQFDCVGTDATPVRDNDTCGLSYHLGFGRFTDSGSCHFTCTAAPTNYCSTLDCVNTDSRPHHYKAYFSVLPDVVGTLIKEMDLPSGGQYSHTQCSTNGPVTSYMIQMADPPATGGSYSCWGVSGTNGPAPYNPFSFQNTNSAGYNATNPAPFYDGTNYPNTTNIIWGAGNTNPATDATLKTGFGALWDAITKGNNSTSEAIGGLGTNGVAGGTNSDSDFDKYATNAHTLGSFGLGTNATLADGAAALGAADTDAQRMIDGMGSAPSVPGGDASLLAFEFCGRSVSVDPEVLFPGMAGIVRDLVGWSCTLMFFFWFGKTYLKVASMSGLSQLGGVPDLQVEIAGFGGNMAGLTTALVVPIVYIGLWIGLFTLIFGYIFSLQEGPHWTTNPWTGMSGLVIGGKAVGSTTMYLLNLFFPLAYLMSLAWTRLTLTLTIAKMVVIVNATSRFLFGK